MASTKITPFARLLLFLIVFLPVVFVGASYYNGEDPVANLKGLLGAEQAPATEQASTPASPATSSSQPATFQNVQDLRDQIKQLEKDLAIAQEQLARCKTAGVE